MTQYFKGPAVPIGIGLILSNSSVIIGSVLFYITEYILKLIYTGYGHVTPKSRAGKILTIIAVLPTIAVVMVNYMYAGEVITSLTYIHLSTSNSSASI